MNDEQKPLPKGFSPLAAKRIQKAIQQRMAAGRVRTNEQGQMPMPAEVFAALTGLLNAAMHGRAGQMEIGTNNDQTNEAGPAIRVICIPASQGEIKDGMRTIQIPEVFGNNVQIAHPPTEEGK